MVGWGREEGERWGKGRRGRVDKKKEEMERGIMECGKKEEARRQKERKGKWTRRGKAQEKSEKMQVR